MFVIPSKMVQNLEKEKSKKDIIGDDQDIDYQIDGEIPILRFDPMAKLEDLYNLISKKVNSKELNMKGDGSILYMTMPSSLEEMTRKNLSLPLCELIEEEEIIVCSFKNHQLFYEIRYN